MTKVDIVSGFLGAGKTTLIKKLLKDALEGTKTVLIENEFGEIAIDGGFLGDSGIEIKEMNSGCICCSLVGDFTSSLKEVLETYSPDRIIIEPSGVGKLSDVMKAVKDATEEADVELNSAVAMVDASKAAMYMKNFGEFFEDQIAHAGTIILTRVDLLMKKPDYEWKIKECIEMITKVNPKASLITTPLEELEGKTVLDTIEGATDIEKELMEEAVKAAAAGEHHHHEHHHHDHEECGCHDHDHHDHHHHDHEECGCHNHDHHEHHHHDHEECGCHDHDHHDHHHHDHEECGCHDHDHDHHEHHHHDHEECGCHDHDHHDHHHADEIFDSWGMETPLVYEKSEIEAICSRLEDDEAYGMILRAKGMVKGSDGVWIHFDYTPGEWEVREGAASVIGKFCVIGTGLNMDNIKKLFEER